MTPGPRSPPLVLCPPSRFFWVTSQVPVATVISRVLSLVGLEHTKSVSPCRHAE